MQSFIDRDPSTFQTSDLLAWLTQRIGAFGDTELGASADDEQWFGDEDGPEPDPEDPDEWKSAAAHSGYAGSADGKIDQIEYQLRVPAPDPMCFQNAEPNPRAQELKDALVAALTERLGKPSRKTKREVEFKWDGGSATVSLSQESLEPFLRHTVSLTYNGEPFENAATQPIEQLAAKAEAPNADDLKEELNGVLPDCFDCGMQVTSVEVKRAEAPYQVTVNVKFDPYTGEWEEDSIQLEWSDATFDVSSAAIEELGELVDSYR